MMILAKSIPLTRNASDLNTGNLGAARLPVSGTWNLTDDLVCAGPAGGKNITQTSRPVGTAGGTGLKITDAGVLIAGSEVIGTTGPTLSKLQITDTSNNGGGGIRLQSGSTPSNAVFQSLDVNGDPWAFFGNNMYLDSPAQNVVQYNVAKNSWGFVLDSRPLYNLFKIMYVPAGGALTSVLAANSAGTLMLGANLGANPLAADATVLLSSSGNSYLNGGNVGMKTNAPTAACDINSDILRLRTIKTLASAGAVGDAGSICWDADYLYLAVGTNTWKRAALSTWP